jgi:hypothetical protein
MREEMKETKEYIQMDQKERKPVLQTIMAENLINN